MDIEVNTAAMKSDASKMMEEVQALRSAMSSMNDAVNALTGMWEGSANAAFRNQYVSDYENMNEICAIVDGIIENINYAVTQYSKCDSEIRDIIAALKI